MKNLVVKQKKNLDKQINFKTCQLELEDDNKVIIDWVTNGNKKFKFPKVTYFEINSNRYRIKWNYSNLKYNIIH